MLFRFFAHLLSVILAEDASQCQPYCHTAPCSELHGNPQRECGTCSSDSACNPAASDYSEQCIASTAVDESCATTAGAVDDEETEDSSLRQSPLALSVLDECMCRGLVAHGMCDASARVTLSVDRKALRRIFLRFCDSAALCINATASSAPAAAGAAGAAFGGLRRLPQRGIYDARANDADLCEDEAGLADLAKRANELCTDGLEDEARLADRGFFVVRNVIPADERKRMAEFVRSIPTPSRLLCGTASVQPAACMLTRGSLVTLNGRVRETSPFVGTLRFIREALLDRWLASPLHRSAALGWPLEITGGEFIAIHAWRFAVNASCLMQALLDEASASHPDAQRTCLDASHCLPGEIDARSYCWLRCTWKLVQHALPAERVRALLADAELGAPTSSSEAVRAYCTPRREGAALGDFRENAPLEPWDSQSFWRGQSQAHAEIKSHRELVRGMGAWLTNLSSLPVHMGYHDWHMDGPHDFGRVHKAFLMVDKHVRTESAAAAADDRQATNIVLMPASTRYAHNCALHAALAETGEGRAHNATLEALHEQFGCAVALDPGDLLFFREDVWHRTQDTRRDRLALILDVARLTPGPECAGGGDQFVL